MKTYSFDKLSYHAQAVAYGQYVSHGGQSTFTDFRAVVVYECIRYQSNGFEV